MQSIETANALPKSYAARLDQTRLRRILVKLFLICAGTGVGLSLSELAMRALHIGHTNTVIAYNDRLLKLKPHIRFMNYIENKNLVEINNLGFHDHDRDASNNNYRILFLGDSFLEGRQVPTEKVFTVRLEKKFVEGGQKIETINGGIPGTGTPYQYVLWKEFFAPNIKFDRAVLCLNLGNDLRDNNVELASTDAHLFVDRDGKIVENTNGPSAFKQTVNHVRDFSVLANTLYESAYRVKQNFADEAGQNGAPSPESTARPWQDSAHGTLALIKRWKSELAAQNLPFDLVIIDRPGKLYNKFESDFIAQLQATCVEDRIDCLRLKLSSDPFESYSFDGIGLGHFNERGHELAADELYDYLKSRHPEIFKQTAQAANGS